MRDDELERAERAVTAQEATQWVPPELQGRSLLTKAERIDRAIANLERSMRRCIAADRDAEICRAELDAARRELDALVMG